MDFLPLSSLVDTAPILYIPGAFSPATFTPVPAANCAAEIASGQNGLIGELLPGWPGKESSRQIYQILSADALRQLKFILHPVGPGTEGRVVVQTNDDQFLGRMAAEKTDIWAVSRQHLLEFEHALVHPATSMLPVATRVGETLGGRSLASLAVESEIDRFALFFQPAPEPLSRYELIADIRAKVRALFDTLKQTAQAAIPDTITALFSSTSSHASVAYQDVLGLYIPERFNSHDAGVEVSILCQYFSIDPQTGEGFNGFNDRSHLYVSARIGTFSQPFIVEIPERVIDLMQPGDAVVQELQSLITDICSRLAREVDVVVDTLNTLRA